jgi:hypothetical protein
MSKVFMTLPDGTKHEIKPFTAKKYTNTDREEIRLELIKELKKFVGLEVTKKRQDGILKIFTKFAQKYQLTVKVDDSFFDDLSKDME